MRTSTDYRELLFLGWKESLLSRHSDVLKDIEEWIHTPGDESEHIPWLNTGRLVCRQVARINDSLNGSMQ